MLNDVGFLINFSGDIDEDRKTGQEREKERRGKFGVYKNIHSFGKVTEIQNNQGLIGA